MENYKEQELYHRAKKRLDKIKGFYGHLASYVIVNIFLIILIGFYSGDGFWSFETFATAFFWGIGLAFHAVAVFGIDALFGKDWEQRKLQEFINQEKNEINKSRSY
ncbi:2TM domain-containing protein [Zhouia spongiae]|uniref:2TM domain-containing protein n=1 Tax=Zhouia spongiae TaxID=2202721 RepID=A0ABY3YJ27_9FLAO|nr:2TM domain-containing protein [Zhouia spongiae]UNY97614.1 2TM domain-containing protein [Zhouia spongiae]